MIEGLGKDEAGKSRPGTGPSPEQVRQAPRSCGKRTTVVGTDRLIPASTTLHVTTGGFHHDF
jgi:hypothetical protein